MKFKSNYIFIDLKAFWYDVCVYVYIYTNRIQLALSTKVPCTLNKVSSGCVYLCKKKLTFLIYNRLAFRRNGWKHNIISLDLTFRWKRLLGR